MFARHRINLVHVRITSLKRTALRTFNIDQWITQFTTRFKFTQHEAMNAFVSERYSFNDVRKDRKPSNYIQQMVSNVKDCGFNDVFQQFIWAWRNMDAELRRDIPFPITETTFAQFLSRVNNKKVVWQEIYARNTYSSLQPAGHFVVLYLVVVILLFVTSLLLYKFLSIHQFFTCGPSSSMSFIIIKSYCHHQVFAIIKFGQYHQVCHHHQGWSLLLTIIHYY